MPCLGYVAPHTAGRDEHWDRNTGDAADMEDFERDGPTLLRSTYYGHFQSERTVPLTQEFLQSQHHTPPQIGRLADIGLVRDQDQDPEAVKAALRREVELFLRDAPTVNTTDGKKQKIVAESTIIWVWDRSKEITFDEQIYRHLHSDEQPLVETLMDRPLLGLPCVDEHMYGRQGLCPIACLDLTDRGGCMAAQIVATLKQTIKVTVEGKGQTYTAKTGGNRKGGKDERPRMPAFASRCPASSSIRSRTPSTRSSLSSTPARP